MPSYFLTHDAEKDLRDVARYSLNQWGEAAFHRYKNGLKKTFSSIGNDTVKYRHFSQAYPQLRVCKYKYHYIFYLEGSEKPIIIGVIHEKRDIVSRLTERLDP